MLKPVIGEFKPGYIYGKIKTHKPGNPLRPIICQIPTPTYETAKTLHTLLAPYLPSKYQINSTDQFLDIIRATDAEGIFASLDVESLFTNVPVNETIEIICDEVYRNPDNTPLPIPENTLKQLLKLCTQQCPL